jgi:hypothetical protein
MSDIGKRVINAGGCPINVEGVAVADTTPGTVLSQSSSGLSANANAATVFGVRFLVADKDQQRSRSVDDDWEADENMVAIAPRPGDFVNVLVATGQTLVKGTALASDGAGLLTTAATDGTEEILAYSDEAVTTTATELVRVVAA